MNTWKGTHKGTEARLEELSENKTRVIRRSPFSGTLSENTYDISFDRFVAYYGGQGLIQQAFPELSADDREFIMTGITPKEWPSEYED